MDDTHIRLGSYGVGVLCGIAVHHGIFIRGEWHIQAPSILICHVWVFFCLLLSRSFTQETKFGPLFQSACWIAQTYVPGLMLSILIYRVFFHRLTKAGFPGPPLATATKLWHVWACRNSKNHEVLYSLHKKHGDFVRIGKYLSGNNAILLYGKS
jgi:hypothetical protein